MDILKYGIWNVKEPQVGAVNALVGAGYAPLVSMVLSSRGIENPQQADEYLSCDRPLPSPLLLTDMEKAVRRIRQALDRKEKIVVYGDYDVDGITATCLLTDFLRKQGADCLSYIPGRLEEGYGLNVTAITQLKEEKANLIITVDCGITAVEEAELCRSMGIDLVITDHHECKEQLPRAVAVVDPHRPDGGYPHKNLSGVGVAFKLAAAISGDQEAVLEEYSDMVCLGTVADVMQLRGENRVFVQKGLRRMTENPRVGIAALMAETGCDSRSLSASTIGFMLAPRINAAGRMGQIDLAVDLFLTRDPAKAASLAQALCELNRQRQAVETEIYRQAVSMLPDGQLPKAIVLADETWHQGVVGIVASRIAEEYCCPTFLICMDGDHGKASSRSYGGFNLFASLSSLSHLLESYGGHELAAGFTISRSCIPAFRQEICALADSYYSDDAPRTVLEVDCEISPELLTLNNVSSLQALEPCGSGCPRPVLMMEGLVIERIIPVGGGKHIRLRLKKGKHTLNAIYFSATAESASIAPGELVDAAFVPQVNEFRGEVTVQMNILDIRPSCSAPCLPEVGCYRDLCSGSLTPQAAKSLLPDRSTLAAVWRCLQSFPGPEIRESPMCLCRKIVRRSGAALSLGQMMACLDIFSDVELLTYRRYRNNLILRIHPREGKADLNRSKTMQLLLQAKER